MITALRDKIAYYVTKNSDTSSWKNVRQNYGYYSYLAFLCLTAYDLESALSYEKITEVVKKHKIEDAQIVDFIIKIEDAQEFAQDIFDIVKQPNSLDIINLYQEYLTQDFVLSGQALKFTEGKNSRDILGSYYTQENFAYQITEKAIEDYLSENPRKNNVLKVADFSCGGGTFLISAIKACREKGLSVTIYGCDVDPIAVLITRLQLAKETTIDNVRIVLGNPLLPIEADNTIEVFKKAAMGRYYHPLMGIALEEELDIIVGNPPWEKIRFEEKKFLHHYLPKEKIGTRTEREQQLRKISKTNFEFYNHVRSDYEDAKRKIKANPSFELSSCGELNTYALFTELSLNLIKKGAIAGLIIKSSLVKMQVYSKFLKKLTRDKNLYELYMFINRKKIFHIDSREEFSVIYLTRNKETELYVALNLDDYNGFSKKEKVKISYDTLHLLNPDTGMIPNIKNNDELNFLISIYEKNRTFDTVYPSCKFGRLVHLTNHSSVISRKKEDSNEQIYEGKFIEIYTGKYATFKDVQENERYKSKATARLINDRTGDEYPEARFFIQKSAWENMAINFEGDYIVAWRSLTSATNKRTMLATLLPKLPTCQSIQLLQTEHEQDMIHIVSLFNSIVFDYIVRLKMAGLDLTQTIIKQIPVPSNKNYEKKIEFQGIIATISTHISARVSFLYENDYRLSCLFEKADKYKVNKPRKEIISELDRLVAILYGIDAISLKQIALTFEKYYTKEEVEKYF